MNEEWKESKGNGGSGEVGVVRKGNKEWGSGGVEIRNE